MIKRLTMVMLAILVAGAGLQAQGLKGLLNKAKEAVTGDDSGDVGMGLKEALNAGVGEAVDFLSAPDGYYKSAYKILLPEEAQQVIGKLKAVPGFSNVEEDLLEYISEGHLSGASLDVFPEEPLPPDSLLWKHPRVNITPHIASLTEPDSVAPQIVENYNRMREGKPLLNVVSREKGY